MGTERPLRVRDIADELGCARSHVYRLIAQGVIPSVRIANAIRIPRGAWRAWLQGKDREALAALKDTHAGRATD